MALLALLCEAAVAIELPAPAERLRLEQSRLVALLESLAQDDRTARWELANLTLEVMGEAYREALRVSLDERPGTPARRLKLARWQEATADLIRSIDQQRQHLLVGGDFTIYADAQEQVIVTVDGAPLVLAGLAHNDEKMLETRIVERFCAFNPCVFPQASDADPLAVELPAGDWLMVQGQRPLYRVGSVLHCRFDSMSERRRKALTCRETAREILQLRRVLVAARTHGIALSWPVLAHSRHLTSEGLRLILDTRGTWLTLDLPLLAQLPDGQWRSVIDTIESANQGGAARPLVFDGESLRGNGK